MKKIFLYLLTVTVIGCNDNEPKKFSAPRSASVPHKIYVGKGSDNGVFLTGGINPGDTVVFRASLSPFSYCYVNNISGTKEKPVVFINEGGSVRMTAGMDFHNCQYIKFSGSGSAEWFGFYINQSKNGQIGDGVGLNIAEHSAHIEAERFWVDSAQYGSWAKNEHFCDSTLVTWVLDDLHIHDFKMTHLGQHGFYYGATEPFNKTRPSSCNGVNKFYDPSRLGNIKIHDGYIHDVGRNGVMISLANTGMSEVYNLDIDSTGNQLSTDQGAGISLGGFTRAYVHHNKVKNTWLWGIVSFGGQTVRIENNTVDSSGWNARFHKALNWPQNVMINHNGSVTDSTTFTIKNNSLSHPGVDVPSIEVYDNVMLTKGNVICLNLDNTGKQATFHTGSKVVYSGCDVPVVPTNPVRHKGYFLENRKRVYYTMYTDGTYVLKK
jgi:hypothetical protein